MAITLVNIKLVDVTVDKKSCNEIQHFWFVLFYVAVKGCVTINIDGVNIYSFRADTFL